MQKAKLESETHAIVPPMLTLLPWALLIVWGLVSQLLTTSTGQEVSLFASLQKQYEQFAGRTDKSFFQTIFNYWFVFEQFVLASPYFVTYGIFGFFLYGLFRIKFSTKRILMSIAVAGYLTLGILVLQSAFQAYQCRYLLPLIPFVLIIAG